MQFMIQLPIQLIRFKDVFQEPNKSRVLKLVKYFVFKDI